MGRLRSIGGVPPLLSVALVGAVVGLLVGFGLGYRAGSVASTPGATHTPERTLAPVLTLAPGSGDLQADSVSYRLELAYAAAAPGGWAVCRLDQEVTCDALVMTTTDPRVPPSEFGLGWYANLELTRVKVSPAHMVVAANVGEGAASAWLARIGPGDAVQETVQLLPVNPSRGSDFYFDLGYLGLGHYVVEVDFLAVPQTDETSHMVRYYLVGFVVS